MEEAADALDDRAAQLMSVAAQLVREHGIEGAARVLGVEHRTLAAAMSRGAPSRRVRAALERLARDDGPAAEPDQGGRLEAMEAGLRSLKDRVDALDANVRQGLEAVIEAAGHGADAPGSPDQVRDLVVRVARLERGAEGSPDRLDTLEDGIAVLMDRVEALDVLDSEIRVGLDRVIGLVERGGQGLAGAERMEALDRRVGSLEREGDRAAGPEQAQRIASLEEVVRALKARVDDLDAEVRDGLGSVMVLAGRLSIEAGAGGEADPDARPVPSGSLGAAHTGVVTAGRQPGEEETYGTGMALVTEWRRIRGRRGEGTALERARTSERVMELEVEMLGSRELTLPPETEPLHPTRRAVQLGWRRRELHHLRIERARREAIEWLRSRFSLGLWRR